MKTQKGFSTFFTLLLVVIVIAAGIYLFQKRTIQVSEDTKTEEVIQDNNIEIVSVSDSQIVLSDGLIISIDELPDEIAVSPENSFGSSDRFKNAKISPDDKWLAIAVGGAAHDFGWLYNLSTAELKLIAFQYGGSIDIDQWQNNTQVVLNLETPEPATIQKVIDVNNISQYPN